MRKWLIQILGGIPKDEVLTHAIKKMYNTIGAEDILSEVNGSWVIQGKPLHNSDKQLIVAEAQVFYKSKLWEILKKDIKYKVNQIMFERSRSTDDLIAGKMSLWTLDCIETRLNSLNKGSGHLNSIK